MHSLSTRVTEADILAASKFSTYVTVCTLSIFLVGVIATFFQ